MKEILNALNIDRKLIRLSLGELNFFDEYSSKEYYGKIPKTNKAEFPHPPFFIPILIDHNFAPVTEGLVKHWFIDRKETFGFMDFGSSFETSEFALTSFQFIEIISYDEIEMRDCIITKDFENTLNKLGVESHYILELAKADKGHNELKSYNNSNELINFYKNSNIDNYQGDFPTAGDLIIPKNLENACFCEIVHKEWIGYPPKKQGFSLFKKKPKYQPVQNIPEWLKPETDKQELFEKYVNQKEYGKAWLTINGPGFTPKEVGERMQRLKAFSEEKAYHLWTDFWCEKYGDQDSFIFM